VPEQDYQYIKLPDGSYGKFAANASDDVIRSAIQKDFPDAFKPPPDTRSLLQKGQDAFDKLTTVTPEQRAGHGAIVNAAQEFGAGAIQGAAAPFVHPLDTLTGAFRTIAHPIDTAVAIGRSAIDNPAKFAGNIVGGAALGEAAAPIAKAAVEPVANAASKTLLLGKTPAEAYESALRPPVTMDAAQKASAVQGGLENAIPLSKAGLEKIADRVDALNKQKADVIATDPNRPIDPNGVANRASDFARARFANQVNAQADLDAIEASKQQFLKEQGAKPGVPAKPTGVLDAQGNPVMTPAKPPTPAPPMGAAKAQAMKTGTYQVLKGKFGEQGSAAVEMQKSLAYELKEEIANQFPEISGLNSAESKLFNLEPLVDRAVNRMNNQGMFRLGTGAVAGTVKALGGSNKVAAVAAVLKQVLDDPMVKSRLAIAVSKGGKIPYPEASAKIAAYSAALGASAAAPTAAGLPAYSSADNPNQSTNGQP
jgi:hypothetical protein